MSDDMEDGINNTEPNLCAMVHVFDAAINDEGRFDLARVPLPPPWYRPTTAPACNEHLHVPAEKTNDGRERNFYCDRMAGHPERGKFDNEHRHRQVTDNAEGRAFTWPV